jgi:hypothetical protein
MPENAEILLRLLLDEAANAKTQQGIKSTYSLLDQEEQTVGRRTSDLSKKLDEMDRGIEKSARNRKDSMAALRAYEEAERKALEKTNQVLRARGQLLTKLSSQLQQFGRASTIAGTAMVVGIFAETNRYAKGAEQATAATIAWNRELSKIGAARTRVDEVLVSKTLPLLSKAAEMATKAAVFIEKNPQLVTTALNAGVALATLGTLATVLAKPIKMIADAQLIAAEYAHLSALEQNTAASLGKGAIGGAGGVGGLLGGGLAATVASVMSAAAVVTAGVALGALVYDKFIAKKIGGASTAEFATVGAYGFGDILGKLGVAAGIMTEEEAQKNTERFAASVGRATGAIDKMTQKVNEYNPAGTSGGRRYQSPYKEAEVGTPAYAGYTDFQVQTVLDIRNVNKEIANLDASFASSMGNMMQSYRDAEAAAEAQYSAQRNQIIRDGGIEIKRIEEDHQREMEKLARERDRKQDDATRSRDALAFVKAQREYNDAAAEADESTNIEIKRRRQDIALRLKDLSASYNAERKIRLQNLQNQMAQAKAEFEYKRKTLLAEQHDLIYALTHEKEVKAAYYAAIIADAAAFASAYRATLAGAYPGTTTGAGGSWTKRAAGGYADYGMYLLGDRPSGGRGPREFVMNGPTTAAAERIIGGSISQDALLNALAGGQTVNLTDRRRFDTSVDIATRRAIANDTIKTLTRYIKRP